MIEYVLTKIRSETFTLMSLTNLTSDITYPLIFKNGDYNKIIQIISERVNGFGSKICFSK